MLLIKSEKLAKFIITSFLISFVLGCFGFYADYKIHYVTICFSLFSLFFLSNKIEKEFILMSMLILIFNFCSQLIGGYFYLGSFNTNWFLQIGIFSILFLTVPCVVKNLNFYYHVKIYKTLLLIISVIMFLCAIYVLLSDGISNIFNIKASYARLYIIYSTFGLLKFIIPLFFIVSYFFVFSFLRKKEKIFYGLSFFIFMLVVQVKTVFLSILIVALIFLIRMINNKNIRLLFFCLLFFIAIFLFVYKYQEIAELSVYNGRYIFPIITSVDYFSYPFGFGFGNYSDVMKSMMINLNYSGEYNSELISVLNLGYGEAFNTSESDILQFGVSFGFIFLVLYFYFIIRLSIQTILSNKLSILNVCVLLLLYSGFYQDYSQNIVYWLFFIYTYSLSVIYKNR